MIVTGKNNHPESTAKEILLEEEVKSVNGLQANDFKNECDFILWRIEASRNDTMEIVTMKNKKITIKKQVLKS